ncbi:MAG: tRNA preQ1(34) S-adenosylmethionine ribosyltransferase-isomerase QueA [Candidatus Atribacteria bacterium]|nr:tRNA preQ1(34) S-adenosylmethionine ribosyltransferase-isomerase QueA [Candidatus Atribacteria bacterium]
MKLKEFDYYLPMGFIAQKPMRPRDHSRLMVLNRSKKEVKHRIFKDIVEYLKDGDVLVLNNSRVLPSRLYGYKEQTKGKVEVLLVKSLDKENWEILAKPGKRIHVGTKIIFSTELSGVIEGKYEEKGSYEIKFNFSGNFKEILKKIGQMPTPPYIKEKLEKKEDYQTVYADNEGSIAAPTAGFHFTKSLFDKITAKGIDIVFLILHVGRGTFAPVRVTELENHKMSSEYYFISKGSADKLNKARREKRRIVSVGTTTTRTLESAFNDKTERIMSGGGWSEIFIYPGYQFKAIDVLITNFHLPKSTPLMMATAFAGKEFLLKAYQEAIEEKYRFYSFGDAMVII